MNRHRIKTLAPFLLTVFFSVLAVTTYAQATQASGIELTAQAGLDGFYKSEFWVPVQITISNNGAPVDGHLQIIVGESFTDDEVIYRAPLSLATQSQKQTTLYVHLPDLTNQLTVQWVDDRERTLQTIETNKLEWLALDELLYGVVSSQPGQFGFLEDFRGNRDDAAVAYIDIDDLPEVPAAWNTLDVLVLHDEDSGQITAAQKEALKGWVSTGGQLIVAGGPAVRKTTNSLNDLLPVAITGEQSVADLPELRSRAGTTFRDPGPYLVTSSNLKNGEMLIDEDGLPILARRNLGRGAVYFLALDPGLAPLADWDGSRLIWQEIAMSITRLPGWATGANNGYAANNAISSLPSLALPSAAGLFLFLLIYISAVGPLNYVILTRLKRRELAWLTIPALVIVFSGVAFLAGFRLKGNEAVVNQMSIAYGHVDGDMMRVQSLTGLYSPRRSTYDLTLPGDVAVRPFNSTYRSLSGGGNIDAVVRSRDVSVAGVRVDVGGIQPLVIDTYRPVPDVTGRVILRPDGSDLFLDITVENHGSETLDTASVLLGQKAIPLGDLNPGDVVAVTEPFDSLIGPSSTTGVGSGFVPTGPATSPLIVNYETILGTSEYFSRRDVYPRWQLLEAVAPDYNSMGGIDSPESATLIAWSDQGQINIELDDPSFDEMATTLYFLELPMTQTLVSGQEITVPLALLNWRVLGENGVFSPAIFDLYFPPGWIEFEYVPWPEFKSLAISDLKVVLRQQAGIGPQPLPSAHLWDWHQELWIELEGADWGSTRIEDPEPFLGPGNIVRLRMQNNAPQGIGILEVYPEMTGRLDQP